MTRARLFIQTLVMALSLIVLTSCGGGGGAAALISSITGGGVGSGGTGITLGTIIGFGSIIVDADSGTHYSSSTGAYYADSSTAAASTSTSTTQTSATALGIGQQLEITLDSLGNPTTVVSNPSLVGAVTSVTQTSGVTTAFVVNNISVRLNASNIQLPVTYLVGFSNTSASTINVLDSSGHQTQVEVHGYYAEDSNGPFIQATRVVALPYTNTVSRTLGVVSNYTASNFTLAGTSGQSTETISTSGSYTLTTPGITLANGQFVNVYSSSLPSSNTITANAIGIKVLASGLTAKVTGLVYGISGTTFKLSGVTVNAGAATIPSNGTYVVVDGITDTTGTLIPITNGINTSAPINTVRLIGTITNYISNANFQVRGTTVDASGLSITAGVLSNGVNVDVSGTVNTTGSTVTASSMNCFTSSATSVACSSLTSAVTPLSNSVTPSQNTTVEFVGTINASPAPSASSGFAITQDNGGGVVSFTMASRVGYESGNATGLAASTRVKVEAYWNGSSYVAYGVQYLSASGAYTSSSNQSGSEVIGTVSGLVYSGSTYTFSVNNVSLQWTCSGTCPLTTLVNGARVDVHFTPGSPNIVTGAPYISSSVED